MRERDYCLYVDGRPVGFTTDFRIAHHILSMLRCLTLTSSVQLMSIPLPDDDDENNDGVELITVVCDPYPPARR